MNTVFTDAIARLSAIARDVEAEVNRYDGLVTAVRTEARVSEQHLENLKINHRQANERLAGAQAAVATAQQELDGIQSKTQAIVADANAKARAVEAAARKNADEMVTAAQSAVDVSRQEHDGVLQELDKAKAALAALREQHATAAMELRRLKDAALRAFASQ